MLPLFVACSLVSATSLGAAQVLQPYSFGTRGFSNAGCAQLVPAIQNMIPVVSQFRGCAQQSNCQQLAPVIVQRAKIVRDIGGQCLGQGQASAFEGIMDRWGQCGSMTSARQHAGQMQTFLEQLAQELQKTKKEHQQLIVNENQLQNQLQNHEQMIQQLQQSQQFQQQGQSNQFQLQGQNAQFQNFETGGQQNQDTMFSFTGNQGQNMFQNVGQQAQDNQFQVIRDTNAQTTGQQESGTRGITIVLERLKPRMAELTSCAPKQCQQLIPQVTSDLGQLNAFTPTTQIQGDDASVDYTLSQGRQDLIGCGSRLNSADDLKNLAEVARKVTIVLNRYQ